MSEEKKGFFYWNFLLSDTYFVLLTKNLEYSCGGKLQLFDAEYPGIS